MTQGLPDLVAIHRFSKVVGLNGLVTNIMLMLFL